MKILITGANGTVGSSIIKKVISDNDVIAHVYDKNDTDNIREIDGLKIIYGNIYNESSYESYLPGVDIIIHLAGIVHNSKADKSLYEEINYLATIKLFDISKKSKVKHFIFASTIAVYGLTDDSIKLNEDSHIQLNNFYAESKYNAEKYIIENSDIIKYTILRLATIYGPADKGNIKKLFHFAQKGIFISFGNSRKSLLNIDNLTDIINEILLNSKAKNKIYNVADNEAYSFKDIYNALSEVLGKKIIHLKIHEKMVFLIISLAGFLENKLGVSVTFLKYFEKIQKNSIVSIKKLFDELNYKPNYSLINGLEKYYKLPVK